MCEVEGGGETLRTALMKVVQSEGKTTKSEHKNMIIRQNLQEYYRVVKLKSTEAELIISFRLKFKILYNLLLLLKYR